MGAKAAGRARIVSSLHRPTLSKVARPSAKLRYAPPKGEGSQWLTLRQQLLELALFDPAGGDDGLGAAVDVELLQDG